MPVHSRARRAALPAALIAALLCASAPTATGSGADGVWSLLSDPATAPQRMNHAWIYDPLRDRLIIFGGSHGSPTNGLMALSLSPSQTWTRLVPSGAGPTPYDGQQAFYDPVRDRMIVFGGYYNCDVWALSLSGPLAWMKLAPAGSPPPVRAFATTIYDPFRDRMILFGGEMYSNVPPSYFPICYNDVWALSLSGTPTWSPILPAGQPPLPRFAHSAVYDPLRDRMIVCVGDTTFYGFGYFDDLWQLSFADPPTWTQLAPSGDVPAHRANARLIYDSILDRLVLYGGDTDTVQPLGDTWALPLAGPLAWQKLAPANDPGPHDAPAAIFDPVRDRLVIHGGGMGVIDPAGNYVVSDATFGLSLSDPSQWQAMTPSVPPAAPDPRGGTSAVYDSKRKRVIVYGGTVRHGDVDTWAFDPATHAWTPIVPAGPAPTRRDGQCAIYDPVGDRMVIFGGENNLSDVWSLAFDPAPAWTQLPSGPSGRQFAAAAYDPARQQMIVSGGRWYGISDGDTASAEVWALALAGSPAWTQLPSIPSSEGIYAHSMVYDPVRDRLLTIGGSTKRAGTVIVHSLDHRIFALPLGGAGSWSEISSTGTVPQYAARTIYDPYRDRLVMLGGQDVNSVPTRSLFARPAADAGSWTQLATTGSAPALDGVPAVFDRSLDQIDLMQTAVNPATDDADQVWAVGFSGVLAAPPLAPAESFAIGRVRPDPARGAAALEFSLPDDAPARLEVVDVAGRSVFQRDVGALGSGTHVVPLAGTRAPGLYFARLTRAGRSLAAKFVEIR